MKLNIGNNRAQATAGETPETMACEQVILNTLSRDHRLNRSQIDTLMDTFRRVHADMKKMDVLRSNGVPSTLAAKFILELSRQFFEPVGQDDPAPFLTYWNKILDAKANCDPHKKINDLLEKIKSGTRGDLGNNVALDCA